MTLELLRIRPNRASLLGSTAAQTDIEILIPLFKEAGRSDTIVEFDFAGVEHTNPICEHLVVSDGFESELWFEVNSEFEPVDPVVARVLLK